MRRLAYLHHRVNRYKEPIWHIQLAIVTIVVLQLLLDSRLAFVSKFVIGGIELVLLGALMVVAHTEASLVLRRTIALALTALVSLANIASLLLIIATFFRPDINIGGEDLLVSSLSIYVTNIIIFGMWYWEMDFKGGSKPQDFLFTQMNAPEHAGLHNVGWRPSFLDYLYISVTNATAFSPTDTMPLTHRAKMLMAIQSLVSITVVVLALARAVSVIG